MTTTGRHRPAPIRFLAFALAALLATAAPAGARQLLVDGSVSAHVADTGFCETEPSVEVRGPAAAFDGDRFALYRAIAILSSIVPAECPSATAMRVLGIADGTAVWQGRVTLPDGAITERARPAPGARIPLERAAMVAEIQAALNDRGFAAGPVDGLMGPSTSAAIRAFQRTQGRPIDGRPDPGLVRALRTAPPPAVADSAAEPDDAPAAPESAAPESAAPESAAPESAAPGPDAAPGPPDTAPSIDAPAAAEPETGPATAFPEPPPPGPGRPGAPIPLDALTGEGPGRTLPADLVLTPDPGGPVAPAPDPAAPVDATDGATEGKPAPADPGPTPPPPKPEAGTHDGTADAEADPVAEGAAASDDDMAAPASGTALDTAGGPTTVDPAVDPAADPAAVPAAEAGPPVGRLLVPFRFADTTLAPGPIDQATATAALARSVVLDGDGRDGVTLAFDDGARQAVTTCDEWVTALNRGGRPATTADRSMAGPFVGTCDPLIALSFTAAPPDRAALLSAPVPPLDPAAWSAGLAPALSGDQERRRADLAAAGASLADIAEPASMETGPGTLTVTWRGLRRTLAPRALAQADDDPAIEVLVHVADQAIGGSHRRDALIAVDRDPATGQYRLD